MRRFVTFFILFLFAIPFGVSISGCSKKATPTFCNGGDSGITTGTVTNITLQPIVFGMSLNYAQIGQVQTPTATDCKGNSASVGSFTYGTTDMTIADVQPTTGKLCGGTWNRNTGGGIPDYTVCNPTNKSGIAYISASAEGATSNPLPVYVHAVVTSIVLGSTGSPNCSTNPDTSCCPLTTAPTTAPPYTANACLSQSQTAQLVARVYAGTGSNQTNISCQVGHLQFSAEGGTTSSSGTSSGGTSSSGNSSVVTIDQNGVATANQPGSVLISANIANASSSAGYFSTCPPTSITLTAPGTSGSPIIVNQNNPQPLTATAVDKNNTKLTGLTLEFVSTSPTTVPASTSGSITPILAGAASITAICQPPTCNTSAYNQIGLFGNGKPVVSNSIDITAPGTNSTVLYMASTKSKYVVARDFTQTSASTPFLLPYVPNSMVISEDGSTIYMGSSTALMVLNAVNSLGITRTDTTAPGTVLAVSPDNNDVVISDPVRQTITLENSSGTVLTTYGASCTAPACHAAFSPDSQTLYISAGSQILVYSTFTGWTAINPATTAGTSVTDVAITVPSVGAYFAGPITTARGYCPISTQTGPTTESNVFYPTADSSSAVTDRIAATNDGLHILGASVTPAPTLSDLKVTIPIGACPATGGLTFSNTLSTTLLTSITASSITGVWPTSDSSVAFVTYNGSGGVVPAYAPSSTGSGTLSYIKLSGSAVAPVSGVLSADNTVFYTGTTGDNLVHLITRSTLTDSSTLAPNLTDPTGAVVPVDLLVQKPRKTT